MIYTGSVPVFKARPVTAGVAQNSGDLQVQLRIRIGAVFLAPTAAWAGGALLPGVGTGVKEILVRVPFRGLAVP